jgi:tripartite ATP-independent transporter DctM subunit
MDPTFAVLIALGAVFLLIALHVPIGVAMALVGVIGFGLMSGFRAAWSLLGTEASSMLSNVDIGVIPLFFLMGSFANASGMASDLYRLASALIGHVRGGLAVATILGCGAFGSIAGSSIATTATFGRIALPQMRARGYKASLASGSIACGGTLGAMVPPSIILVIYGLISEQFILKLFVAAIIPAILAIVTYIIVIALIVRRDPEAGPAAAKASRTEVWQSFLACRPALVIFVIVSGGIYGGVFTVNEAASIGALATIGVTALRRRLTLRVLRQSLLEAAASTAMIYMAIFGASIMSYFVGLTQVAETTAAALQHLNIPPILVIVLIVIGYLILGSIFDETAAMLVTLPFVLPVVTGYGYDPIWWGIINLVVINLGMIIPPIGLNVFVLQGLAKDLPLSVIYRGVAPFIIGDFVRLALLIAFPGLSLWLLTVLK